MLATDADGRVPVIDAIAVDGGFEAALGAAFGDDLDAPADDEAAAHWREVPYGGDDASLPEGAVPLARHVRTPPVLFRRLAQTALVARADGPRLQPLLRPGQRLVSIEGDLWRWDGYVAMADAPRSAAQRLAQRNRLTAVQAEIGPARETVAARGAKVTEADDLVRRETEADREARELLRLARKTLDEARTALANAEREEARIAARRTRLEEAVARLEADLGESHARAESARSELATTGSLENLGETLAHQRGNVEADRAALAEARAAFEGMAREAEIRGRRLASIAGERRTWQERGANAEAQIASARGGAKPRRRRIRWPASRRRSRRGGRRCLSEIVVADAARAAAATGSPPARRRWPPRTRRRATRSMRSPRAREWRGRRRGARGRREAAAGRGGGAHPGGAGLRPGGRGGSCGTRPGGAGARTSRRSRRGWSATGRSASGWALLTSAPTRKPARSPSGATR